MWDRKMWDSKMRDGKISTCTIRPYFSVSIFLSHIFCMAFFLCSLDPFRLPASTSEANNHTERGIVFRDIAKTAGIRFVHDNAATAEKYMIETMGPDAGGSITTPMGCSIYTWPIAPPPALQTQDSVCAARSIATMAMGHSPT